MDTISHYHAADQFAHAATTHVNTVEFGDAGVRKTESAPRQEAVTFGDSWYHDAAIKDAKEAQAHPYQ